MSVTFQILPEDGLVYVRYGQVANVPDTRAAMNTFLNDPNHRPGLKHFVDMSDVEHIEHDVPEFFRLQLNKVESFFHNEAQTMIVYYAPHEVAFEFALLCQRSWEMFPQVACMIQQEEAQALALLGMPQRSLAELLEPTRAIG